MQQQQPQQRNPINPVIKKIKAYLGYQGFSIFKDTLTVEEQHALRKELTVGAYIPKSPIQPTPFPIYRESPLKLYVPRYFGLEKWAVIQVESKISPGHAISLKFMGDLRDYQQVIVEKYLKAARNSGIGGAAIGGGGLLDVDPGKGKTVMALKIIECLATKTLVVVHKSFLSNQWKERIEQFLPGARVGIIQGQLIDTDNKDIVIAMVQSLSMKEYPQSTFESFGLTIFDECFTYETCIHTSDGVLKIGQLYEKWKKCRRNEDNGGTEVQLPKILSYNRHENVFEYKKLTHAWKKEREDLLLIKASKRVIRCTPEHKILTVGNGYVEANKLKCGDLLLCKYDARHIDCIIAPSLNQDQLQIVYGSYLGDGNISQTVLKRHRLRWLHGERQRSYCQWKANMFGNGNRTDNVNNLTCVKNNGFSKKNAYSYTTKIFDLDFDLSSTISSCENVVCDAILQKIDERGLAIWFMDDASVQKNKSGEVNSIRFNTQSFSYDSQTKIMNALKSKFDICCNIHKCASSKASKKYKEYNYLMMNKENSQKLINIVKKYIHDDFSYKLNNSDIGDDDKNDCSKYAWNNKFENWGTIPVTSIEKIKNKGYGRCKTPNVYDIEVEGNHNFVLASSVDKYSDSVNKSYKSSLYVDGIVVSNCHHMGAEVFSRCMMKVTTTYTLGLSGTMQRKDGLSKVFKMFLGDVVHKEKAESDHCVLVKGINYVVDDDEFNEVEYDYRGNPKFSTMISKLCNYNRRSEFIVEVVIKELQHNADQQIMILAHNKSLIQYLFKAIEHRKIATVGYYLGGMKEADLKASESKKIIIATYAMASEGLDIKTLTTLIMATPKTDVCQSVGRILRVKHTTPIVIDIVDAHDLFKNQWQKRKSYYKKQNYRIIVTDSGLYHSNETNGCWTTAYNPKKIKGAGAVVAIATGTAGDDEDDSDDDDDTGALTKYNSNRKQPILSGKCFL